MGARTWEYYNCHMEIHGHIQHGVAVPDDLVALPEGSKVIIVMPVSGASSAGAMSADETARFRRALAELDAAANENPGDDFSGADHDEVLYGRGK